MKQKFFAFVNKWSVFSSWTCIVRERKEENINGVRSSAEKNRPTVIIDFFQRKLNSYKSIDRFIIISILSKTKIVPSSSN